MIVYLDYVKKMIVVYKKKWLSIWIDLYYPYFFIKFV